MTDPSAALGTLRGKRSFDKLRMTRSFFDDGDFVRGSGRARDKKYISICVYTNVVI